MTDELCPVCGCSVVGEGYEKDGVKYRCEPCAEGGEPCDCVCCHLVEHKEK